MVTVTCPGTLGGSDKVEGGAGAMGRLGIVGFVGGCEQKITQNISIVCSNNPFHLRAKKYTNRLGEYQ